MPAPPSREIPRAFLVTVFAVGIAVAVAVAVLGFYGYIGAGIP
jgi:nitrate reductase NapE component